MLGTQTAGNDRSSAVLLVLVLVLAGAMYSLVYLPQLRETRAAEEQLAGVRKHLSLTRRRANRLRESKEELQANQPEIVRDAIRETLHKGEAGEGILRRKGRFIR